MIYILNNVKFGHPKLSKYQLEYFDKYFIPLVKRKYSPGDKVIITGNLFYNTKFVNFNLIPKVQDIFDCLSSIVLVEIVGNDYCINLIKEYVTPIENIIFDINDVSLFQLSKDDDKQIGILCMKDEKTHVVENKFSPRFIEYNIDIIENLDEVEITKDFISLTINSELLENQQNKNIIDLFLNNNPNINVYYTDKIKNDDKVKLDNKNINIRNILIDNIDENLKTELDEIFVIYDEKNSQI